MNIHKKTLNGNNSAVDTVYALFEYAKEVLGDEWTLTRQTDGSLKFVFADPTGSGEQGWIFHADSAPVVVSNGMLTVANCGASDVSSAFGTFVGFVGVANDGSVAIGYFNAEESKYKTWYLLIKFNGKYQDKDVYSVALNRVTVGAASTIAHGNIDIGRVNHVVFAPIGDGVYLHAVYDPISGLTSSDVFGPQSVDSILYANAGMIVKQGNISYLAVLSGSSVNAINVENVLFIRM